MSYLVDRKNRASLPGQPPRLLSPAKYAAIVVESRPNYAVLEISGLTKQVSDLVGNRSFRLRRGKHAEDLRLESEAAKEITQELNRAGKKQKRRRVVKLDSNSADLASSCLR